MCHCPVGLQLASVSTAPSSSSSSSLPSSALQILESALEEKEKRTEWGGTIYRDIPRQLKSGRGSEWQIDIERLATNKAFIRNSQKWKIEDPKKWFCGWSETIFDIWVAMTFTKACLAWMIWSAGQRIDHQGVDIRIPQSSQDVDTQNEITKWTV